MTDSFIKLQTTVKPELIQKHLKYVAFVLLLGGLVLLIAYGFIPPKQFKFLGPLIGIVWFFVVISGFRPIIQLVNLKYNPEELIVRKTTLIYRGRRLPIANMETVYYSDKGDKYGIRIKFLNGEVLQMPYFNQEAFEELQRELKPPEQN